MLSQEFFRTLKTCTVRLEDVIWRFAICTKETPEQSFSCTFPKIFKTPLKILQLRLKGNFLEFLVELLFEQ